ncbi:Retrotransposon gag protein [Corchorus olitorius]|uniref:Retrotransposon gag protein n=1 Tax=Corchorus olitorius TaxID=93759 RepID=A0A1R3G1Z2_9ROSI|nr:Retrotransposon gag protein [Corchorus olitorius]
MYGFQQPQLASSSKPIVISTKEKGNGLGNAGDQQVLNNINERLRELEGISAYGSVDVSELTLVEGLVIPPKFKVPEFEKYNGTKCPREHLISYTRKMAAYKDNEKMMIHISQYSLTGSARKWYNKLDRHHIRSWQDLGKAFITQFKHISELVPDRWSLQAMERKPTETITEYAQRWKDAASQVHPAISDKEQARLFINTFKPPYYGYLLSGITKDFADLVVLGEMIHISIKNGMLEGGESASTKKNQWTKKKEGKVQATFNHSNQYPGPNQKPQKLVIPRPAMQKLSLVVPVTPSPSLVIPVVAKPRVVIPIPEKPKPILIINTPKPFPLKDTRSVPWVYGCSVFNQGEGTSSSQTNNVEDNASNIIGVGGMTISGRCYSPDMTSEAQKSKAKRVEEESMQEANREHGARQLANKEKETVKPVVEKEADEFLRFIKQSEYSVVEQLNQLPAKISLLALLLNSEAHRKAAFRILNQSYVSPDITVSNLEHIAGSITTPEYISFTEDEIPPGGRGNYKALHITA